jgi:protein-tyrosine phosphatase
MPSTDSPPPRHVSPLAGAFNFRDLGGLPARDGRHTRRGLLFRSDSLQALTPGDVATLRDGFGLKVVVDLRLAREVAEEGRGLLASCPEIDYVNAPLEMASVRSIAPQEVLNTLYRQCLESASMAHAVERIAAHAGQPTLFHCAAGKDRTGVVAAMVLSVMGVDDEAIVADYLASAPNMPKMLERFATWPRYREHLAAMPPQVYAVEEQPIRIFLAELRKGHGGALAWAARRGIPSSALAGLVRAGLA